MSLQVWLPLNGNLNNQGLSNAIITASTTPTYINNGKIGKALSGGRIKIDSTTIGTIFNNTACSMAFWYNNSGSTGSNHAICGTQGNTEGTNGTEPRQWDFFNYPTKNDFHWSMGGISSGVLNGIIPDNTWIHFAFVLGDGKFTIYKNGSVIWQGSSNPTLTTYAYDYYINFGYAQYMNDFRIYDHCLSPKEVKEISKGLVLHYKLDGYGSNLNLLSGTTDGINWSKSSFDPIEKVFTRSTISTSESFIQKSVNLTAGKTYTLSAYIKTNGQVSSVEMFCYDSTVKSINNKNVGAPISWTFCTFTFTCNSSYSWKNANIRFDNNGSKTSGTEAILYVKNIKLEEGSIATPWCPNSSDILYSTLGYNDNIEYDCSGYSNNGIKSGTIIYDSDAPRYMISYKFTGSQYITSGRGAMVTDAITVSWWGYMDNWSNFTRSISCTESGGWNFEPNGGKIAFPLYRNGQYIHAIDTVELSSYSGWHHFAATYDGYKSCIYIDGILKATSIETTVKYPITYNATNGIFIAAEAGSSISTPVDTKFNGKLSDIRIYATALSEVDIKELYNTSFIVDNVGKAYAYEYIES